MSVLSWQASTAGGSFIVGTLIQSTIIAFNPSYSSKPWQNVLFVIAVTIIECLGNTVFASQLPRIQKIMVVPHALGWIAVIIVLWVLAPHASAKDVFTSFTSNGGWEPVGLSTIVGAQVTCAYFLICESSTKIKVDINLD
jgi:choline transport protein